MISMSKIYSIRQMRMQGLSVSEIAKRMDISRDTVYKYLEKEDLSSSMSSWVATTSPSSARLSKATVRCPASWLPSKENSTLTEPFGSPGVNATTEVS